VAAASQVLVAGLAAGLRRLPDGTRQGRGL